MNENSSSNNIENDDPNHNSDDNSYISLLNRLKEISKIIFLLEKKNI